MRLCRHCGEFKDESAYFPSLPSKCKECDRKWKAAYRARNSDREAAYWREYRRSKPQIVSAAQKRHYQANKERWDLKQAIRAERKRGVPSEPYTREAIFERDGYECQICRQPVDRDLRYPDRQSATLDHEVPLVAGGADTPANVRTAHLICNLRKGKSTGASAP